LTDEQLAKIRWQDLALTMKDKTPLDQEHLESLQEAYQASWSHEFPSRIYRPLKSDKGNGAGNGLSSHNFYESFGFRLDDKGGSSKIDLRWPADNALSLNTSLPVFKNFSEGKARVAL